MSSSARPPNPSQPSSASLTTSTTTSSAPTTNKTTASSQPGRTSDTTGPSSVSSPRHPPAPPAPAAPPNTTTTTTTPAPRSLHHHPPPAAATNLPSPTNPSHLPTPTQQAQVAQARDALVASLGNALDTELQTRASVLHANQRAIERQERDVEAALDGLRREDARLLKVLNDGSRQVKELGDVQNWAERLERDFLVLEETMRIVREGSDGDEEGSWSCSGSGSRSCSWSGSEAGSVVGADDEGNVRMADGGLDSPGKGKGKQVAVSSEAMDLDPPDAPRSSNHDRVTTVVCNTVDDTQTSKQSSTAAQPSPGAMNWFKKLIWRTSS